MRTGTGSWDGSVARTVSGIAWSLALLGEMALGAQLEALSAEGSESSSAPVATSASSAGAVNCRVIANHLAAPDGLTRHPGTGQLLVTEEDQNRVVMLGESSRTTVIDDRTPVFAPDGSIGPPLRSPEGMCVRSDGAVYVAEDYPGGRLLCFRIGEDGRAKFGRQVEIPGYLSDFAWEPVACSADDRLLLAGSNAEAWTAGKSGPALFMSVLLYRDENKRWWRLLGEPAVSLSSVAFSPDGRRAIYACEIHGFVGWMDLGDKDTRQRIGPVTVNSPESVAVMDDGRVLVAEEKGSLVVLDAAGEVQSRLNLGHGDIETVLWDKASRKAWVTCDGEGCVLEVTCDALRQDAPPPPVEKVRMRAPWSPRFVPDDCPTFLEKIFAGVLEGEGEQAEADFRSVAWKVPMVAMRLDLAPQLETHDDDPFHELTLIMFHPNRVGMTADNGPATTCAFFARRASGKVIRSEVKDVKAVLFTVAMAKSTDTWKTSLQLPVPAAVRVSAEGVANIHMIGMGRTPDFNIVLNPGKPEDTYVLVTYADGRMSYYRLTESCAANPQKNMVISYSERLGRMWLDLGLAGYDDSLEIDPRTVRPNRMVSSTQGAGS
jgi:hypothetical protein